MTILPPGAPRSGSRADSAWSPAAAGETPYETILKRPPPSIKTAFKRVKRSKPLQIFCRSDKHGGRVEAWRQAQARERKGLSLCRSFPSRQAVRPHLEREGFRFWARSFLSLFGSRSSPTLFCYFMRHLFDRLAGGALLSVSTERRQRTTRAAPWTRTAKGVGR